MSSKTVGQKLALKAGALLWLADQGKRPLIDPLPDGVAVTDDITRATTALLFIDSRAGALTALDDHLAQISPTTTLWIAYPKGGRADINRDSLHPLLQERGWRPVSQIAIDDTWSALRFRPFKAGESPFRT